MLNAYHEALEFELPQLEDAHPWKRWIDTALESPDDICDWSRASVVANGKYLVQPAFDSCPYCEVIIKPPSKTILPA
jgi:glycogen operon protein